MNFSIVAGCAYRATLIRHSSCVTRKCLLHRGRFFRPLHLLAGPPLIERGCSLLRPVRSALGVYVRLPPVTSRRQVSVPCLRCHVRLAASTPRTPRRECADCLTRTLGSHSTDSASGEPASYGEPCRRKPNPWRMRTVWK